MARILLLGGNFHPEPTGIGKYNGEMMDFLARNGNDCSIITTYPYYPFWKVQKPYTRSSNWFKQENRTTSTGEIKIYRCPHYIPANPSGFKRILSDISFFISAFLQLIGVMFQRKYDVIITVVPSFLLGLLALIYRLVKGGRVVYHIQDLQIDAAKELGMIKSDFLLKAMFALEKVILKNADYISSISDGMINKIHLKCGRKIHFFPNWVDTREFYPIDYNESLKINFGFNRDDKIVLYSGAIGEKQGLESVLYAAMNLGRPNVKLVICGSGPYKQVLQDKAKEMSLPNVVFLPLQSKEVFNEFLNIADLHLVPQRADAADLVMPSKLTTIFSIGGLSIVAAAKGSSLFNMISKDRIGILVEPEDVSSLEKSILDAIDGKHEDIKENARRFAIQNLTIENVIDRFFSEIIPGFKVKNRLRESQDKVLEF